jgi:DNA-binding MarR family transcriptional regulator
MVDRSPEDPLALLFFAFRDVTAQPDRVLAERGLSRVHHRILYFVARNPGVGPGRLLEILRISKQALARPLRDLVAQGLIESAIPSGDRRTRALALTADGARLEARLSGLQRRRFAAAFRAAGAASERGWREVMRRLASRSSRPTGAAGRAPHRRRPGGSG